MAADSQIAIPAAPGTAPAAPVVGIKTFIVKDPTTGQLVHLQGIVLMDEDQVDAIHPMSERTGQNILAALLSINNILNEFTGCGQRLADEKIQT